MAAALPGHESLTRRLRLATDPSTLGVASGHPHSTSAVIWTRLAPWLMDPFWGGPTAGDCNGVCGHVHLFGR